MIPPPILPPNAFWVDTPGTFPVTFKVHVPELRGSTLRYKKLLSSVFPVDVLYGNLFVLILLILLVCKSPPLAHVE